MLHPDYVPAGCGGVNPVSIGVVIDFGAPLAAVTSSYHDAWVEKESGTRTVVYLQKEQEEADRDFELVWSAQGGSLPQAAAFTESRNGTDYTLLMVMPPQPTAAEKAAIAPLPRETVFIIDTSGSMQGTSIQQAKEALLTGLATLTSRDRFNVVEFNSVTRPMWPDALPVTDANLKHARAWVSKLRADGGTEMAGALTFALDGRDTPGFLRQVVFMTDGAVGNEDQLFKLIAQRLGSTRLFTVGIGSAPNSHFMTKAAQFGRGTFTYIGDLREVQDRMAKLFAKIESPVLKDVSIRWPDGTPVETFPARVPDLYLGEPIVVAAAHPALKGTIVVSGLRGTQPWSVALTPSPASEPTGVGALWARARIASLMDELRLGADEAAIRPAVVKVALEHHLVSRYTSLVAVDVTPTAPGGDKRTALVKASLPHGTPAGQLPQTDTESTLQILLGLLALAAAGMVVLVGRFIPAGGASLPAGRRGGRAMSTFFVNGPSSFAMRGRTYGREDGIRRRREPPGSPGTPVARDRDGRAAPRPRRMAALRRGVDPREGGARAAPHRLGVGRAARPAATASPGRGRTRVRSRGSPSRRAASTSTCSRERAGARSPSARATSTARRCPAPRATASSSRTATRTSPSCATCARTRRSTSRTRAAASRATACASRRSWTRARRGSSIRRTPRSSRSSPAGRSTRSSPGRRSATW